MDGQLDEKLKALRSLIGDTLFDDLVRLAQERATTTKATGGQWAETYKQSQADFWQWATGKR